MIPLDDARVAIVCASLMAFALGFLLGAWLCERKVRRVYMHNTKLDMSYLESPRKLDDLKPGDRL